LAILLSPTGEAAGMALGPVLDHRALEFGAGKTTATSG